MSQQVRGVISRSKGTPVEVTDIVVPDPGPGEAVVRVQSCGVCHTDLHYREGGINDDYPFLLGHEAAGIVEQVGAGVDAVAPGDFVVLNWRAVCGVCRACRRGRPWYCFATHNATQKMTLLDGTTLAPALGIGAFAEKTLVHAGQCTKVDPVARPAAVGLLGCGVMAGLGAAMNTGGVTRGDVAAILAVVAGRRVTAIVATHAHDDHVRVAPELSRVTGAPVLLHPADRVLWDMVHPDEPPGGRLADGEAIEVGGTTLTVLHTPGHSPGACCLYAADLDVVFTGDTLFAGGPGATGRSYSDFGTIVDSIRDRLLTLPPQTVVHTGHGDSTTIGAEAPQLPEWLARGH
ncbi:alcohol dehydrogenase catalytic domain-containing protein [Micromonospora craniellae]|uniref:alcohol dehydrogenase catalytic domain-containing protein n=1 Tax=Micromonospora craniellae TaxID=2294034 RepID=UPI001314A57A|nr:alcohol dehydrogenase catalytic domain-containing protein [Micromonospora craniellae]